MIHVYVIPTWLCTLISYVHLTVSNREKTEMMKWKAPYMQVRLSGVHAALGNDTCCIGKTKRACNRCEVHYRCGSSSTDRKGALIMKKQGKRESEHRGSGSILVCPVLLAQLTLVYTTSLCPSLYMCTCPVTQTTTATVSMFCSRVYIHTQTHHIQLSLTTDSTRLTS